MILPHIILKSFHQRRLHLQNCLAQFHAVLQFLRIFVAQAFIMQMVGRVL